MRFFIFCLLLTLTLGCRLGRHKVCFENNCYCRSCPKCPYPLVEGIPCSGGLAIDQTCIVPSTQTTTLTSTQTTTLTSTNTMTKSSRGID